ncbi:hypothetical protein PILCRDRAFT_813545 [Piloderma croceum F 1598]|uniref:Uncharacterized protein n=1 Tax=Piloderma croceum (strain F 1598) TaxID=765440 RepID=A0A0C3CFR7_PILCF|nr:hypothetical protein PILCRDRAFT_813545 [Piloderma croceum F 1598]
MRLRPRDKLAGEKLRNRAKQELRSMEWETLDAETLEYPRGKKQRTCRLFRKTNEKNA